MEYWVKVEVGGVSPIEMTLSGVSVICGKNSSGKSTILRQLEAAKCFYAVPAADFLSDLESQVIPKDPSWQFAQFWKPALAAVMDGYDIVYSDDEEIPRRYAEQLRESVRSGVKGPRPREDLANLVLHRVAALPKPNIKLIHAKRAVPARCQLTTGQAIGSDGTHLLNVLFELKNSSTGSAEWNRHRQIGAAFKKVTGGFEFEVTLVPKAQNHLELKFRRAPSAWTRASECGQGLSDMLLMVTELLDPETQLLMIEEPENHVHPEMQERLVRFAEEQKEKVTLFSTHSPSIVEAKVKNVFVARFGKQITLENLSSTAKALAELGYSVPDALSADGLVLVEGPSDRPLVEELLWQYGIRDLCAVRVYPLGGDIMDQVDLSVFSAKYKCWAVVDRDPKSRDVRERFVGKCEQLGVKVLRTERYALENYIPLERFRAAFGPEVNSELSELSPKKSVESQLGFSTKRRHSALAEKLEPGDIAGTDLEAFLLALRDELQAHLQAVAEGQ